MQFGQLMPLFAELGALSNKISDNQPYRPTYSSIGQTRLFQDFLGSNCILESKIGPLQPSIDPLELRFDSIESQVGLSEHKVSPLESNQSSNGLTEGCDRANLGKISQNSCVGPTEL